MYQKLAPILERYDVMICPTLAVPAVKANHTNMDPGFTINSKPVEPHLGWLLTYPFNMMNQCPVASVPTGFARNGVPTGLQIVGPHLRRRPGVPRRRRPSRRRRLGAWHRPSL